jgi:hypothetical protein
MGGEEPSQKLLCEAAAFKNIIARSHPKNVFAKVSRSCEPKAWQSATKQSTHRGQIAAAAAAASQ